MSENNSQSQASVNFSISQYPNFLQEPPYLTKLKDQNMRLIEQNKKLKQQMRMTNQKQIQISQILDQLQNRKTNKQKKSKYKVQLRSQLYQPRIQKNKNQINLSERKKSINMTQIQRQLEEEYISQFQTQSENQIQSQKSQDSVLYYEIIRQIAREKLKPNRKKLRQIKINKQFRNLAKKLQKYRQKCQKYQKIIMGSLIQKDKIQQHLNIKNYPQINRTDYNSHLIGADSYLIKNIQYQQKILMEFKNLHESEKELLKQKQQFAQQKHENKLATYKNQIEAEKTHMKSKIQQLQIKLNSLEPQLDQRKKIITERGLQIQDYKIRLSQSQNKRGRLEKKNFSLLQCVNKLTQTNIALKEKINTVQKHHLNAHQHEKINKQSRIRGQ